MGHIDEAGPAEQQPYSQCYSYSSSTIQRPGSAPVTHSAESFQNSSGKHVSKRVQSIGDKVVEETTKNGATTRTLTNLSEAELEDFREQRVMLQKQPADLPAALEADL